MNLAPEGGGWMEFVTVRYDGSDLRVIAEGIPGSGHPSIHPNGKLLVTDAYVGRRIDYGDGTVPIRLIDLERRTE